VIVVERERERKRKGKRKKERDTQEVFIRAINQSIKSIIEIKIERN